MVFQIYMALFCLPMMVSSFRISNEVDSLCFYTATLPAVMLLGIEIIQMKFQGTAYIYADWNMLDMSQLIVFSCLLYLRMNNVDSKALYYPELKLINILLAFLKTMFFVRIYEEYGLLVQMLQSCLMAVVPFAVYYLVFLMVFSICFVILEMEIDAEVNEAEGLNYFFKIVLQTFRTSIGELATPVYT